MSLAEKWFGVKFKQLTKEQLSKYQTLCTQRARATKPDKYKAAEKRWRESEAGRQSVQRARKKFYRTQHGRAQSWLKSYRAKCKQRGLSYDVNPNYKDFILASCCDYCGVILKPPGHKNKLLVGSLDHIEPDGPHALENFATACYQCNKAKGRLTKKEFVIWLKRVTAYVTKEGERL